MTGTGTEASETCSANPQPSPRRSPGGRRNGWHHCLVTTRSPVPLILDHPALRQAFEKQAAVAFRPHPRVEDRHLAAVGLRADQASEALLELDDRFRHLVLHEGDAAPRTDRLQPRF